jgi:hypothetical protein
MPQGNSIIYLGSHKQIKNVKLWSLHDVFLEYEKEGSLHDIALDKINKIKCGEDEYGILNEKLIKVDFATNLNTIKNNESEPLIFNADTMSNIDVHALPVVLPKPSIDYYQLGREDAKKYYSGRGAFVWSLITGPYAAPIIAAVPPGGTGKNNPNGTLYYTNYEYHRGFKNAAHGKKAANALAGLGGWLLFVLMVTGGYEYSVYF